MNGYSIEMKQLVEEILAKYPSTRSNDIELYVRALDRLGYPTDLRKLRIRSNIFMTLTRNRQKIQESNPMLGPDDYMKAKRRMSARRVKEWSRQL